MPDNIRSINSRNKSLLAQFLGLSVPQFLLNLLIAALLLALINIADIWEYFNDSILANQQTSLSTVITNNAGWLDHLLLKIDQSRIPQIAFWTFLGGSIYVLIWLARGFLTNLRNDLLGSQFIRPASYNKNDYWRPILFRKLFFITSLVVLIGLVIASVNLVNALARLCASAVGYFRPVHSLPEIIGSWLAVAILLQLLLIMLHVTNRSWHSINDDL